MLKGKLIFQIHGKSWSLILQEVTFWAQHNSLKKKRISVGRF